MSRIGARDVAVLTTPTWQDACRGAFAAWIYISLGVPLCFLVGSTALSLALFPQRMFWFPDPGAALFNMGAMLFLGLIIFVFTAAISGPFVALLGIPAGMLLSRALSRVARWRIHFVAYFALGAVAYGAVLLAVKLLDPINAGYVNIPLSLGPVTPLVIGACVAAGWATAWRQAVRRAASPLSETNPTAPPV